MPALPSSKQSLVYSNLSKTNMIDGNANPNVVVTTTTSSTANNNNNNSNSNSNSNSHNNAPTSQNSQQRSATNYPPDKQETENKHFRNRGNTKFKLLVRSHAMRESPSPPREPHNDSSSSHSPQIPIADGDKKFTGNLSPNSSNAKLNNNESMFNSNLCPGQSPKQMRNTATSPTCRTHTRNGQSSPSQTHSPKNITSPVNGNKSKATSPNNNVQKCNNCLKNNQTSNNERPGLLQTPISPSKSTGGGQALQHSPKSTNLAHNEHNKSEHSNRRPNTLNVCNNQCSNQCGNTLSVSRPGSRHKLRHQNLSQGSFDSATSCLSRDSSTELYTDSTGIDLEQFIAETINRNQKDRTVLLKIEKDLIEFTKDRQKVSHKFPNMSSYNRMLVHRVAAYFGMEHNVDQTGLSVIVTRTKNMRIPETRFKEHIRDDLILTEEPRRSILKRDSSSFEDSFNFKSSDRLSGEYCRRSKSFEEREEEYERARRRIFKDSSGESSGITSWPYWSSSESSDASARYQLLHPADHNVRQTRLMKGQSFDGRDSFRGGVLRPSVSKSFSFGGYTRGMLSRVDSVTSTHSAGARLTKQDSGTSMCSRLSPSSSGYKSQSQRSDATISPSPSPSPVGAMACNHTQISSQDSTASSSAETNGQTVIWAVSSISSVPAGSIIIDPQTNQPYTNADGSIYRFDPENPPKIFQEDHEGHVALSKPSDSSSRSATNNGSCGKPENKRKEKQSMKCSNNLINNNNINSNNHHHGVVNNTGNQDEPVIASVAATATTSTTTTTAPTSCTTTSTVVSTNVTNSSTSPSLPFTPPLSQQPPIPGGGNPTGQSLVKSTGTVQTCNHNPTSQQPYASYLSTSEPFNNQAVYQPPTIAQQTVMMAPRTASQGQPAIQPSNNGQAETIYNQNPVYANYAVPVQQGSIHNPGEIPELSRYFLGMNICYQRAGGDSQNAPPSHGYSQPPPAPPPPPPSTNQTLPAAVQPNYWQTPSNQIPTQQMMYFVPPSGTAMSSELHQQQRLTTTYSFNTQTMTPPSQTTSNYVSSYPVPYNSMPTVNPTPGEYTYPPPVHMVPAYYPPGQPSMPPPPVMYRVPTPPNTPTSNQMPGVPMMYVNSDSYPPPMVSTGTFGANGTSPAPGAYMTPALVPNLVFRQNVPVVTGMRASTPCSSQRASRSPTPAHELFGAANGERNAQVQPRYPLPMYQDVRIVQGDMRFMHPGVAGNPRFQYAPVPSPPVVQGCPRPYRPPSYSSNSSGGATTTSFDGRSQKIRKQRSKISSLPPSGPRPNLYQTPAMQPVSSNTPRDIREGTVKVTITRRNHFVQC